MGTGSALRELARFLDDCERSGAVESVALVDCADRADAGALTATLDVTLSADSSGDGGTDALSLRAADVDADGRLHLSFASVASVVPATAHGVEVDPTGASVEADGTVRVSLSVTVDEGSSRAPGAPDDERGAAGRERDPADRSTDGGTVGTDRAPVPWADRGVPPFEDPDLLADVYDSCETFAEMTDALGVDVTPETVRRYMIDHGIHRPNSYDTGDADGGASTGGEAVDAETDGTADAGASGGADPDPGSNPNPGPNGDPSPNVDPDDGEQGAPVVLADGIGLPDDVTVERLIETVEASNTVYEVGRDVGVDREDALDMLRELDLLDLVVGRLATEAERDISREEVVERLRRTAAQ
jgi:hypothetical protein